MAGLDFDPFAHNDPLSRIGHIPGLDDGPHAPQQRAAFRRPLPAEESESLGKQALATGASGLKYVLGTLDKPGQAVRGVLAGKGASSLKHLVPFADSMGLVNEADHTSGRDLTDKMGVTQKGDQGWGAWGKGLVADIATDPLSYATFGAKHALTASGKLAQKAGTLKGLSRAEHVAQGYSGLARIGFPGVGEAVIGTGRTGQRIAGGLDAIGGKLKFGNPIGRGFNALFDNSVGGAVDEITQRGFQKHGMPTLTSAKAAGRADQFDILHQLDPLIKSGNSGDRHSFTVTHAPGSTTTSSAATPAEAIANMEKFMAIRLGRPVVPGSLVGVHSHKPFEHEVTDAARAVAEGVPHPFNPTLAADVAPIGVKLGDIRTRHMAEARHAGVPLEDLSDPYASYVARQATEAAGAGPKVGGRGQNMYPVAGGSTMHRDEVFRNIPGGTNRINNWFDRFASDPVATTLPVIRQELEHDLIAGGRVMTPQLHTAFDEKAAAVAGRLAAAGDKYKSAAGKPGLPFFSPDLAADVSRRSSQHERTLTSANAAIGTMTDNARLMEPGMVPLAQVARKLGLKTHLADQAAGTPMEGALVRIMDGLGQHGAGPSTPFLHGKLPALKGEVNKFGLTPEHFDQITKAYGKWAAPEQIKAPIKALDSFTNAFKALAYPLWIPSHVRNAMTALTNNSTQGVGYRHYMQQLGIMTGRGKANLDKLHPGAGLTREAQIDAIRRAQFSSANIGGGHGMSDDISQNAAQALATSGKRFTPNTPMSDRVGVHGNLAADTADLVLNQGLLGSLSATGRTLRDSVGGLFDKSRKWGQSLGENYGLKGVGGATKDTLPAVVAGRKAGTNIEDFFRGAQWNKNIEGGATAAHAATETNRLHFDYDGLTSFEKNFMRRAVPFYTFAARNLPLQAGNVLHNPGMINAQYKPFYQPDPDGDTYVPKYLASGAALPTGPEANGSRQYISKLGLPAEEAFEKLHMKNGLPDVGATVMDYASMMNPLIKAPLEQLFNKQFHTQRDLSDLKAPAAASALGRLVGDDNPQLLSQVLANSPITRFVTSADKLMDNRKGLGAKAANLLTGVRVSDVDVEKQRAVETRQALEEMMRGHSNLSRYSSFYVKPEEVANLSPEEVTLMRKYTEMQDNAKAFAKAKRERIGVRP